MFRVCRRFKRTLTLWYALFLLFVNIHETHAVNSVSDQNLAQIESVLYDAAVHGWVIDMGPISDYDLIVAQTCKSMNTSLTPCTNNQPISHVECSNMESILSPDWDLAGYYLKPGAGAGCVSIVDIFNSSTSLVHVADSGGVNVRNSDTLLKRHAYDFGNQTFEMELKVTVLEAVESVFTVKSVTYRLHLTIPALTVNALSVEHQCTNRGFVAPPKSVFDLIPLSSGEFKCIWKCDPSYVRQPFNKPPLMSSQNASEAGYTPSCLLLPTEYVSATVELKLYIDSTSEPDDYSQQIYDAVDSLVLSLKKTAQDMGLIDPIIIVKHKGSVYDTIKFDELLQQHSARQNNLDSLTIYRLTSDMPLRRLLQTGDSTKLDFELEGLIIATENENVQPDVFVNLVSSVFEETMENYTWPPELKVNSFSDTQIKTYVRNTESGTPPPLQATVSWQRILLFCIEFVCVVLVLIRCTLKCREMSKSDLEEELLTVKIDKIDTTKDL